MESRYDRFLRLKNTLSVIDEDRTSQNELISRLDIAEKGLNEAVQGRKSVESKISKTEKRESLPIQEIKGKILKEIRTIDSKIKQCKDVINERHKKLGNRSFAEYESHLPQKHNPELENKLFSFFWTLVFSVLFLVVWGDPDRIPEEAISIMDVANMCGLIFVGICILAGFHGFFIEELTENQRKSSTERYVKRKMKKHKQVKENIKKAEYRTWRLKDDKKYRTKEFEGISELIQKRAKYDESIQELGEETVNLTDEISKLQTRIVDNWDEIAEMIPNDSSKIFPNQLNE